MWHSNDKYRRVIYQCNHKFDGGKKCSTPHLTEDEIKAAFVAAYNRFLAGQDEIIRNTETVIGQLSDSSGLETEREKLEQEMAVLAEMVQNYVTENARTAMNQGKYQEHYSRLQKEDGFHIQKWCGGNHIKRVFEGFPLGEPFCCAEVVTNSSEKVIISYLICETSKQAEDNTMVKNNIEVDVKVKCIENETTQAQLAGDIGTTKSYVNRIIKKQEGVVNKTFVQMMEALGYDIELIYVKREEC